MTLKKLLSIKFITHLAWIGIIALLSYNILSDISAIKYQNALLLQQKAIYERLVAIPPGNEDDRKVYLEDIALVESIIKDHNLEPDDDHDPKMYLDILILFIVLSSALFGYLNERIEKKKIEVNDDGEKML